MPIFFVMQGKCLFSDISRPASQNENVVYTVIPIPMLFCSLVSNKRFEIHTKQHTIQCNATYLMTSKYFTQDILQDILSQILDVIQSDVSLQKQVH